RIRRVRAIWDLPTIDETPPALNFNFRNLVFMKSEARRAAACLTAGEARGALFAKGAHAFLIVVGVPQFALQVALDIELLFQRVVARGMQGPLGRREGTGGAIG